MFCACHTRSPITCWSGTERRSADITVVPCCVDADLFEAAARSREATRAQLGIADRVVVAYNGSLQWYQWPEESLRIFKAIRLRRPDAHLLALTKSVDRMRRMCQTGGIADSDFTVLSAEPAEIPRYLASADVGLLPRQDNIVNRVASPVKFGEYLASGTPVILSDRLGDYSDLVRRERVGLVLPPIAPGDLEVDVSLGHFLAAYLANTATWRCRCHRVAQQYLDWSVHLPKIAAMLP